MKLIFLDRLTFKYKDNAYISDEFEIVLDSVVKQKSSFKVNKENIKASVNDIVVLKENNLSYIGIVESITKNDDKTSKVQTYDFKELFNVEVPCESFSGNVVSYLGNKIKSVFISNSDTKQNLKFLEIKLGEAVQGELNFDEDTLLNINDLIELLSKTYNIIIKYNLNFLRGRFSSIVLTIEEETRIVKLRHDLKAISEYQKLIEEKNNRKLKYENFETFIKTLENGEAKLEWDDVIFNFMLEKAVVHKDKSITFKFYCGFETTIKARE